MQQPLLEREINWVIVAEYEALYEVADNHDQGPAQDLIKIVRVMDRELNQDVDVVNQLVVEAAVDVVEVMVEAVEVKSNLIKPKKVSEIDEKVNFSLSNLKNIFDFFLFHSNTCLTRKLRSRIGSVYG